MPKQDEVHKRIRELQLKRLQQQSAMLRRGNDYVPKKKDAKPLGYKLQNTFEKNLRGVPGSSRGVAASAIIEIEAARTGTRTRKEEIGLLRSARNANTTQGNYVTSVVTEGTVVVSDAQGRKVFGR